MSLIDRGCVKTKADLAVNHSAKFKLQNLADSNRAWDFFFVSINLQKCRGFLRSLDPLQPLMIPESRLLFIYFAARGAAGRTDCCSRVPGLRGFSPLRETERWQVSFGKR
jgi:hypothetical protein